MVLSAAWRSSAPVLIGKRLFHGWKEIRLEDFTPLSGFIGGVLIGLASVLLLWLNGRIAGISGIVGGMLSQKGGEFGWRAAFVAGLLLGAFGYTLYAGGLPVSVPASVPVLIAAGLMVGFGTRLGSGCTSGHGVCGIGRLSRRSFVATGTFMAVAVATVYVVNHAL